MARVHLSENIKNKINETVEKLFKNNPLSKITLPLSIRVIKYELELPDDDNYYEAIRDHLMSNQSCVHVDERTVVLTLKNAPKVIDRNSVCVVCGDIYAMPSAKHNGECRCYMHD